MRKILLTLLFLATLIGCQQKETADLIVYNANVYTVNPTFDKATSFAVKEGKFIAVGSNEDIANVYMASTTIDAKEQTIVPGLIDAHCHFYRLGLSLQKVNLRGTKSYEEILEKLVTFQKEKNTTFITGQGWDQNDWDVKEFPTKEKLDLLFPNTPVALGRVDGHALLVNEAALRYSGISNQQFPTKITGGEFLQKDGQLTGVLIDAAMDYIKIPEATKKEAIEGLKDAQEIAFSYGLTTVNDAGLDKSTIDLIDSLQTTGDLKMRIYAMVSATQENLDHYISKGILKTDRLNVRSFKVYGDGALGSRGAAMKTPYSDRHNHYGAMIFKPKRYEEIAAQIAASDYQMNTHAIGDSTNTHLLKIYKKALKGHTDRRWKIEHAQIIAAEDFELFTNIVPSVQPTHATSDMYWAEDRIGAERMKGAYAYKKLLDTYGRIVLGTDFPVEKVNPFLTFYAATIRKDTDNYPKDGFQTDQALSREETLKGMTIWAAHSNFTEAEKGSIETGKFADFVILNQNIMDVAGHEIPNTKVHATFIHGEKVHE